MPSPEQKRKTKTRVERMSVPFCTVREDDTRGAKHGRTWWQYDHWKARDATKGTQKEKISFQDNLHMKDWMKLSVPWDLASRRHVGLQRNETGSGPDLTFGWRFFIISSFRFLQ